MIIYYRVLERCYRFVQKVNKIEYEINLQEIFQYLHSSMRPAKLLSLLWLRNDWSNMWNTTTTSRISVRKLIWCSLVQNHIVPHTVFNGKLMSCPASFLISKRLVTGTFANIATVKSPAISTLLASRNSWNNRNTFFRLHQSSKSHRIASDLSNLNQPELELYNVYLSNLKI